MTYHELMCRLKEKGIEVEGMFGNKYVLELSKATKKKPGYVKIAIPDDLVPRIFTQNVVPLLLFLPAEETKEILKEVNAEHGY